MSNTQTLVALGVVLSFVWAIAFWLLKDKTSKVLEAVDRIPSKEWFDSVNAAMQRIPSEEFLERLVKHMDRTSEIGERVALLERSDKACWVRLERDHDRLGKVESELPLINQRIALLERGR
jgi:hypothetical protein